MTDQSGIGDFIFGTLTSNAERIQAVIRERQALSTPELQRLPDGLRITITAGPDAPVTALTLYFTTDGGDPTPGTAGTREQHFQELKPTWDTLLWAYLRQFEIVMPTNLLLARSTFRYRISGTTPSGDVIQAGGGKRFSYLMANYLTPAWFREAIIYQIFVDRFSTDNEKPFADHDNLAGFYGGTLRGITERLPYIADLGVNTLWLSPIFSSPSHHGYDSTDFLEIEARLGTKADLKILIDAAHARNIRVLLDFVPNHVSNQHPFFKSAKTDTQSPYRDYFTFTKWPDEYHTFFGVKHLPQINNEYPPARRYVIDSAVYWMTEFGVDGFRLDFAYGPSHDFWTDYYAAVKAANPESIHFGEIIETPALLRSYEGRMDGALDFHLIQAIRQTFVWDAMPLLRFDDWLNRHQAYFSGHNFVLPSFLDNHDMNRFLWVTRGDTRRLKMAALLQFTLPAPPIIYYGTETGLSQRRDVRQGSRGVLEESRLPMNWSEIDADLLTYYKRLIAVRHEIIDLLQGTRTTILVDDATKRYSYGYSVAGTLSLLVLLNHSPQEAIFDLATPSVWRDLFSNKQYGDGVRLSIQLSPESATVLRIL